MPSISMVAGEASGDASGGALAREIRKLCPDARIWGAGGSRMHEAGVELAADFSRAGAIGIFESLRLVPWLLYEQAELKRKLVTEQPDALVLIDFGAFNVPLGKYARKKGISTIYYFPPGSWRRRPRDHSSLIAAADKIISPFPWSAEILKNAGADSVFLGHPMLDVVKSEHTREEFLRIITGDECLLSDALIIGMLPGSRSHEINNILPAFFQAAKLLEGKTRAVAAYVIAASSQKSEAEIRNILTRHARGLSAKILVLRNMTYSVMAHSDLLLSCSGTATLEAMILGTPMIIVYRGSRIMKFEYLFRKKILEKYAGMPNIIADREICPELLGDAATPEVIAEKVADYLRDCVKLKQMKDDLSSAKKVLGSPGATAKAAKLILEAAGACQDLELNERS